MSSVYFTRYYPDKPKKKSVLSKLSIRVIALSAISVATMMTSYSLQNTDIVMPKREVAVAPKIKKAAKPRVLSLGTIYKDKNVIILTSNQSQRFHKVHLEATKGWENYLTKNKINYQILSLNSPIEINKSSIVIAPQLKSLTMKHRRFLSQVQAPILFTGDTGYLNGLGSISTQNFMNNFFNVNRLDLLSNKNRYIKKDNRLWFSIDPSKLISQDKKIENILKEIASMKPSASF